MSVFLNNLDDYILPSQACVNPLVSSKLEEEKKSKTNENRNKILITNDFSTSEFDFVNEIKPNLIKSTNIGKRKVATVSLNDCLACR